MNVFTYGSLMFDQVWCAVVGTLFPHQMACLEGHVRLQIKGQHYPALVPLDRAPVTQASLTQAPLTQAPLTQALNLSVAGRLYCRVPPVALAALDRFEGEQYRRVRLNVNLADGSSVSAFVYLWRPSLAALLSHKNWQPEQFARCGLSVFMRQFKGFGAIGQGHRP
jgi:gamma-glutamylcyclotransferase (GGCT)/AIG2-like uncharacterized protein YtfP